MKTMRLTNNPNKKTLRHKHIPQRSCIACRNKKDKRELIRLVCHSGIIKIDYGGKSTGRGVYLCPTYECWEIGLKKTRLEYALRTKLASENRQILVEYGKSLPKKREAE